jgi:hypothetical protein
MKKAYLKTYTPLYCDPARLGGDFHGGARKLEHRATAHRLIFEHVRKGGVGPEVREMERFGGELFHLTRECGVTGLPQEAEALFGLACGASGSQWGNGLEFRWHHSLARLIGRAHRVLHRSPAPRHIVRVGAG